MSSASSTIQKEKSQVGRLKRFALKRGLYQNKGLYLMLLPVIFYYILFHYIPMAGVQIAFKNFSPRKGIYGSPWLADPFQHFKRFIDSPYFGRLIRNTLTINIYSLIFGFPLPIILAIMINEVHSKRFKTTIQTITYAPYFLSIIVVVGILRSFLHPDYGILNDLIERFGGQSRNWLQVPTAFYPIYIGSGIWQTTGWDAIIYVSALAGVSYDLHEAAMIDGANRFQRIWHINLPSIRPTIVILLIMRFGNMMNVGFQKAYLLQNDLNLVYSDIIATYSYRLGILGAQYSFATAIGLLNSVINFSILLIVNYIARKVGETSLW